MDNTEVRPIRAAREQEQKRPLKSGINPLREYPC